MVRKQPDLFHKIRWRYMFETARLAFSKMRFDTEDLKSLEKMMETATNLKENSPIEESLGEGAISASRRSRKAQRIVIEMNLKLLKQRNDSDAILCFLKNELHGRRLRRGDCQLTDKQSLLLNHLMNLVDELDALGSGSEDETVEEEAVIAEKRGLLITERDDLIQQIQCELARPIDAYNKVESPNSQYLRYQHTPPGTNKPSIQGTPSAREKTPTQETSTQNKPTMSDASNDITTGRKAELDIIHSFCKLTGAEFDDAEKMLVHYGYNVNDAVDFYYADQEASERVASPDTDLEAAMQLSLMSESPVDEATKSTLPTDDSTINSELAFTAINKPTLPSMKSLEQEVKLADIRGNFRRLMAAVQAEASQDEQMSGEHSHEKPTLTARDILRQAKGLAKNRKLTALLRAGVIGQKLFELEHGKAEYKDPTLSTVTETTEAEHPLKGRSHSGRRIQLDPQGNFLAPANGEEPPKRNPWDEFRAMRSRLQVQYYGAEA
jgi:hypothetical protein